jgi:hypothetical protein
VSRRFNKDLIRARVLTRAEQREQPPLAVYRIPVVAHGAG